jgi:hypothetical protein
MPLLRHFDAPHHDEGAHGRQKHGGKSRHPRADLWQRAKCEPLCCLIGTTERRGGCDRLYCRPAHGINSMVNTPV